MSDKFKNATPRPWAAEPVSNSVRAEAMLTATNQQSALVAAVYGEDMNCEPDDCMRDNTALIVEAVNTYDSRTALIAEMAGALEYVRERITKMPAADAVQHDAFVSIQMRCASVLASAKKEMGSD